MKKLITLLVLMFYANVMFAQDVHAYVNGIDNSFCCNTLQLDNGDMIIIESLFFDGPGFYIRKIDDKAELINSVFVENVRPDQDNTILAKNPIDENSYILADFRPDIDDGMYHYCAIVFDEELNIVDNYDAPIPLLDIDLGNCRRMFLTPDGNILVGSRTKSGNGESGNFVFMKLDVYGKILEVKYTDYDSYTYNYVLFPFFMYDEESSQYGCLFQYKENGWTGDISIMVLDEDLNTTNEVIMDKLYETEYQYYKLAPTIDYDGQKIIALNDGGFAMVVGAFRGNKDYVLLAKLDKDFSTIKVIEVIKYFSYDNLSYHLGDNSVVMNEDGSLYVSWMVRDKNLSVMHFDIHLARIDNEFNEQWEEIIYGIDTQQLPRFYASTPLNDGGLLLGGCTLEVLDNGLNFSSVAVMVKNMLSTSEYHSSSNNFSIYPNPAKDFVKVSTDNRQQTTVKIYNTVGMLVGTRLATSATNEIEINVSEYNPGIYFINISNEEYNVTKKIVIE